MYVQVRHQPTGGKDWAFGWGDQHKDYFYLNLNELDTIGITKDEAEKCFQNIFIERLDDSSVNNDNADYTKCLSHVDCGADINWTTSTETGVPDYNNDLYDFSCDGDNVCTLKMSDNQTFIGIKEGGIVNFRGIPFAEPPGEFVPLQ